jgi:hypothetical protein
MWHLSLDVVGINGFSVLRKSPLNTNIIMGGGGDILFVSYINVNPNLHITP